MLDVQNLMRLDVQNPRSWASRTSAGRPEPHVGRPEPHVGRPEPRVWTSRTLHSGRPEPHILDVQNLSLDVQNLHLDVQNLPLAVQNPILAVQEPPTLAIQHLRVLGVQNPRFWSDPRLLPRMCLGKCQRCFKLERLGGRLGDQNSQGFKLFPVIAPADVS